MCLKNIPLARGLMAAMLVATSGSASFAADEAAPGVVRIRKAAVPAAAMESQIPPSPTAVSPVNFADAIEESLEPLQARPTGMPVMNPVQPQVAPPGYELAPPGYHPTYQAMAPSMPPLSYTTHAGFHSRPHGPGYAADYPAVGYGPAPAANTGDPYCNDCDGSVRGYLHAWAKCHFGCLIPAGNGGAGTPIAGKYHRIYPQDPYYFDGRDGQLWSAQGYGVPVSVPLAPVVGHQYNYGWGVPSSRLTPISRVAQ